MSRMVWFAAGAATGVYGVVRARRFAANFTPDGLAARAAAFGVAARLFTHEVSTGMAERETELRRQADLARQLGRPQPPAIESGRGGSHADR